MRVDTSDTIRLRKPVSKIHQKYKGNDFVYTETIKDETLNAWQRFKLWLSRKIAQFFKINSPASSMKVASVILRVIGILLLIFVVYRVVRLLMNDEGNWIFGRKSDKVNITATNLVEDIHKIDFYTKVEEALANEDYRLAIRYYYLLSLKRLSDKDKIEWDSEKTNYDYYQEIKDTDLKKQFQYISYIYDYAWYGEFDINKGEYNSSESAFKQLMSMM